MPAEAIPRAKVVHISTTHTPTDIRIFRREAVTLARAGYNVIYISPGDAEQIQEGIKLVPIPRPQRRLDRLRTMFSATRIALDERADVYHVHDPELLLILPLIRLFRPSARLVFDSHENFRRYLREEFEVRPRWLRKPVALMVATLEYIARFYGTVFVAANPAIKANFPAGRTVEVSNFPSLEQLPSTAECSAPRPQGHFIYVGVIAPEQRIHLAVEALGLLPENSDATLILAGTFHGEAYERQLRSLPGWQRVKFLGRLAAADVPNAYRMASAAIIPMITNGNGENARPNKLFECLGCGTPAIITYQEAWRPFIEGPQTGWFLREATPKALAKLMTEVMDFPEETRRRGGNARRLIERELNWQREGEKLLSLYATFQR